MRSRVTVAGPSVRDPRTGRIVTRDLVDYHVPVHADMPAFDIIQVPEKDPNMNELGVKGIGELGMSAPRLLVFGTGHDVVPIVELARRIGWHVVVCARHASHAVRERFRTADELWIGDAAGRITAGAFALVTSHDIATDRDHLAMLLGSPARYIGVLGPTSRTNRLLDAIGIHGDPRLHAPVGLALGAEGPEQIALSVVAELQAVHARAAAVPLRELAGPIHARAS